MGDLTKNLSRWEFECPCPCGVDTVDYGLVIALQNTVDHFSDAYKSFDIGIHINSGNRCRDYNKTIKGASSTSKHTEYRACDFYLYDKNSGSYKTATRIHEDEIVQYLEKTYPKKYGIGQYKGRTHFDTRSTRTRWDKR